MRFIANILTDKNLKFTELYNVVSDKKDIIEGIPTLVIGWEYTKKMYPNANILDWEIEKNVFWTYGSREKRSRYEENIEKFKTYAIKQFVKSVNYVYYNILTASDDEKHELMSFIESVGSYMYAINEMLYIKDEAHNRVIGISLRDIEYIGKDKKKIFSLIYKNSLNHLISLNSEEISWDFKNALRNYNYVIPYLFG